MSDKVKDVAKRTLVVELPSVREEAPPPVVNVSPVVQVLPPEPRPYTARITQRDANGFILEFVIVPDASP